MKKKIIVGAMLFAMTSMQACTINYSGKGKMPHPRKMHGKMFQKSDTNNDGFVDLKEFKAFKEKKEKMCSTPEECFKKMDANNDGKLTKEEIKSCHKGMKKGRN